MIPSPLQLEQYFFTRIELHAHPEAHPEQETGFAVDVNCARHEEDPRRWMITLTVVLKGEEDDSPPAYTGDFEIVGMFRVTDEYPEDNAPKLAHINGAAILYGTVREMVTNMTARGPFPPILLPTATFIDECTNNLQKPSPRQKKSKKNVTG